MAATDRLTAAMVGRGDGAAARSVATVSAVTGAPIIDGRLGRTSPPGRRKAGLALALSVSLAVAACGSSSSSSDREASPSPATSTPSGAGADAATPAARGSLVAPGQVRTFAVPRGARPHDVAPASDGSVWYTAQGSGRLGSLDPTTGRTTEVELGPGSAPHGVIVGPDGAPWVTDSGLNAVVRVDPVTREVRRFPMPAGTPSVNLNTAVFDGDGRLWFTGQAGYYGRVDPGSGKVEVFQAPGGRGPYGITVTPSGTVWYASLAGNHVASVDRASGGATPVRPPTAGQGARRVWSDSGGRVWVSEWNAGQVAVLDPASGAWREWRLPGDRPQAYAVYVDDRDKVWLSDFGANAIVRFDPADESFRSFALPEPNASVRQLLGRPGEVWGAESSADRLVVVGAP